MKHPFLYFGHAELAIEYQQLLDEGAQLPADLCSEFETLLGLDLDSDTRLQPRLMTLFDKVADLPTTPGSPYREPSDLPGIRSLLPSPFPLPNANLSPAGLYDRVYGAWLGRCAGCTLGSPVEGLFARDVWPWLKQTGRYPLRWYIDSSFPKELRDKYPFYIPDRSFIDHLDHVVENDDLNFTVASLAIFKQYGPGFTPADVAQYWLDNFPLYHVFTAERVALRNLINMLPPPLSASYHNPYREWIGAQIRADFWGYVAPGQPALAAEYAFRDATVSHVKNGIYGEMWAAAMISAAFALSSPKEIIEAGLAQIPATSRLAARVQEVIGWHERGDSEEDAIQQIHQLWDDSFHHHWCHTISNAQIVTLALLWGGGDFARSICLAVQAMFDTDCNAATVGSILGILHGASHLPGTWISPLSDRLDTCINGYNQVKISDLAKTTIELMER